MKAFFKLSIEALALGALVLLACGSANLIKDFSALVLLIRQSFGMEELSVYGLSQIGIKYFAILYFQIVEGNDIYQHYGVASVYYFSRQMKKGIWFLSECGKLFLKCLYFSAIYLGAVGTILSLAQGRIDTDYYAILAYQTIVLSLWLYFNCLLTNTLSLLTEGVTGFMVVMFLQMAEICLLTLAASDGVIPIFWMVSDEKLAMHAGIMKLNPVFHLFLGWHSGDFKILDELESMYHPLISFHMWESIGLFLLISFIVSIIGLISVKKAELYCR